MTTRSGHAGQLNFKIDRLREFQTWYRTVALPSQRSFQDSPDLIRSLRLPMTCPSAYVAALVAYWWLEDCGRDAIGWLLTDAEPNWIEARKLLSLAQTVSCQGLRPSVGELAQCQTALATSGFDSTFPSGGGTTSSKRTRPIAHRYVDA